MKPIRIEVFTPLPEAWSLCAPCAQVLGAAQGEANWQARGLDDLPPDWQAALEQLFRLVLDLRDAYGSRVEIRLVDPGSLPGLIGALRYGVRRYPTLVIAGREKITSLDRQRLDQALRTAGMTVQAAEAL